MARSPVDEWNLQSASGPTSKCASASCYLARAGLSVLVLERRYIVGGACVTEETFPGGSVTLAHVYLNREMVDLARAGQPEAAMQLYMNGWGGEVPRRLLRPELREALKRCSAVPAIRSLTKSGRGSEPTLIAAAFGLRDP